MDLQELGRDGGVVIGWPGSALKPPRAHYAFLTSTPPTPLEPKFKVVMYKPKVEVVMDKPKVLGVRC